MSLSHVADLADLLAAIGIILSLAFVGYEMRQTRKQTELTNWRELLQTLTHYKAQLNDPVLAELVVRGHADYGSLSEAEKLTFGLYLEQGVHIYGNFLKHNDSLPRKLEGLEGAIANHFHEALRTPGGASWWEESHRRMRFMPATYRITDELLGRRAANGGRPLGE